VRCCPSELVDGLCLDFTVDLLTVIRIPGDDSVTRALLREDLRRAVEEQMVAAGLETDDDAHGFLLAGERNYLGRVASHLPNLPAENVELTVIQLRRGSC